MASGDAVGPARYRFSFDQLEDHDGDQRDLRGSPDGMALVDAAGAGRGLRQVISATWRGTLRRVLDQTVARPA